MGKWRLRKKNKRSNLWITGGKINPGGENSSCKGPKEATYLSLLKKAKEGLGLDQGAKGL